jgi:hypothetical protein
VDVRGLAGSDFILELLLSCFLDTERGRSVHDNSKASVTQHTRRRRSNIMAKHTPATLPPEIRNAIFQHALTPLARSDIRTIPCLNLLATSKQIYNETALLPFQFNAILLPTATDSNTTSTLRLLRQLSRKQLNAIRTLDLNLVGSTFDTIAAAKVMRYLRLGSDEWDLQLDLAARFLPEYEGDLRDIRLTVSARDISVPFADSGTGLQKALDVESSTLCAWLMTFPNVRSISIQVRMSDEGNIPPEEQKTLRKIAQAALGSRTRLDFDFEVVKSLGENDGMDMYPDSYVGLWGNLCPVPEEFRHLFKYDLISRMHTWLMKLVSGLEWAFG